MKYDIKTTYAKIKEKVLSTWHTEAFPTSSVLSQHASKPGGYKELNLLISDPVRRLAMLGEINWSFIFLPIKKFEYVTEYWRSFKLECLFGTLGNRNVQIELMFRSISLCSIGSFVAAAGFKPCSWLVNRR